MGEVIAAYKDSMEKGSRPGGEVTANKGQELASPPAAAA